jgi:hypothetical protein
MLRTWSEMRGCKVHASDGSCGQVHDLFFDDRTGAVRYIVAALSIWPWSRRVLLDPMMVSHFDSQTPTLVISMSRAEIRKAPHADSQPPVSRQQWGGAEWGVLGVPPALSMEQEAAREIECEALLAQLEAEHEASDRVPFAAVPCATRQEADPHLRSAREVIGYEAEAHSGRAGLVIDLWLDEPSWQIAHLSLEVSEPLVASERRIAIPATLVSGISWSTQTVTLNVESVVSGGGHVLRPSGTAGRERSMIASNWRSRTSWGHG